MANGVELIAIERQRQIDIEGYDPGHDIHHSTGDLALAAVSYAMPPHVRVYKNLEGRYYVPYTWPFTFKDWKPTSYSDRIKELTKAGALIAAEIDRLQHSHG
jgi:hypothetical protein